MWLVELAPVTDPQLVPQVLASTLGVREEPERPILETLSLYFRGRETLLVLDNCEHLVEACALPGEHAAERCAAVEDAGSPAAKPWGCRVRSVYRVPSFIPSTRAGAGNGGAAAV